MLSYIDILYIVNLLWYIYRCTWRCLVSMLVCVEFQSCALLSVFMFAMCKKYLIEETSTETWIQWQRNMNTLTYFPWDFPLCPLDFPQGNDPCFAMFPRLVDVGGCEQTDWRLRFITFGLLEGRKMSLASTAFLPWTCSMSRCPHCHEVKSCTYPLVI